VVYILTADQIGSRLSRDAVPAALDLLSAVPAVRPFDRTVEAAKRRPQHVAVAGPDEPVAADAQAVLTLLVAVVQRRSEAAWEAVDLVSAGLTMTEAATKLGVTRQAIGQRLAAGLWQQEQDARPAAARLLG